jgi:glyoxylase-like metal-dependent hydrolase (beta-lactamase superfamily II)
MPLEDDFTYVIRKALKGLALAPGEAARMAGLPVHDVMSFTKGVFSPTTARRLAPVLALDPDALAHFPDYLPRSQSSPDIHRIDLPFRDERVNAWLVWSGDTAILFDTGFDPLSCTVALDAIGPPPLQQVFITHGHVDHIGGIRDFLARGIIPNGPSIAGANSMKPGDTIRCGPLTVRACDLSGHFTPTLGYSIDGLAHPVLVTGDAIFAGSIGGCATPELYQYALGQLRKILTPLPDNTFLLPGHGPATTLGEERVSNPFL